MKREKNKKRKNKNLFSYLLLLFIGVILILRIVDNLSDFMKGFVEGWNETEASDSVVIWIKIIAWVIICVIVLIIYRVLRKKVSDPLNKITEGMKQIEMGNLDVEIDVTDEFEFRQMEEGFNSMARGLREAKKKEEEMNEKNRELYAEIAHDLKTPMTMVLGYAKLLSEDAVPEEKKKEYLHTVTEQTEAANSLLEQLLEYSKLGSTEYKLSINEGDIAECLRLVAADSFVRFEEKNMNLEADIPDKPVIYRFDETQMRRVFNNLIGNAINHNPEGTSVKIFMEEDNSEIKIYIADNGPLIRKELVGKLFDPFKMGDESRNSKGSGLGLSAAKKIVEMHNGTLEYKEQIIDGYKGFVITCNESI